MGSWNISWFTNGDVHDSPMQSVRFDNVTEDFIDGYIIALEQQKIAFGKTIKERLQ